MSDTEQGSMEQLVELMEDMYVAMLTTRGPEGLRSVPMARQEVEPDAEMWFITARDTDHVRALQHDPHVSLTLSSRDAGVALSGRAELVDDVDRLRELWSSFAQAWLPGGPDDPNAALIRLEVDRGEYWDTPGGRVASLISLAKTKVTGDTYDADHGTVQT